jgi:hypothetical protein
MFDEECDGRMEETNVACLFISLLPVQSSSPDIFDNKKVHRTLLMTGECGENYIRTDIYM